MRILTLASASLFATTLMLATPAPVFAQAGTKAMPPVTNQATQGQMDATKKAMEAERRRAMEEEKKKAMDGMKKK